MGDIRISINQIDEPDKSIGKILIEFYETMKSLDNDVRHGAGKRAVKIIMTISDIKSVFINENTATPPPSAQSHRK